MAGAALAAAPARAPSHEALRTHCLLWAADPKSPWAMAHGVTALGTAFAASDGRRAANVIVGDFLTQAPEGSLNPYAFAHFAPDGTPIEPHANLNAKTLVLAGLPPSTKFKTSFGQVTLQQLTDGVQRGFLHAPASEEYWRTMAWTLDLLSALHTPGPGAVFKNGAGDSVDLDQVMDDGLAYLEKAEEDLAEGLAKGQPEVPKRKQGIYAHNCGGLHLVQAVNSWARFPAVRKRWGARFTRQVDVLFYRLGSEARQYDAALAAAPQYKLQILVQMVKFYGHFLETAGRLKADGSIVPTEEQKRTVEKAKALLDHAVRELQAAKAFESMDSLKKSQPQVYLDLIGDSCHAAHGWDYWR